MKNKNKTLFYGIGSTAVVSLLAFLALNNGTMLQSSLDSSRFAAMKNPTQVVKTLVPTNQIREGEMSSHKFDFSIYGATAIESNGKFDMSIYGATAIEKVKYNVTVADLGINDMRVIRNDKDITDLTTEATRAVLKEGIKAQGTRVSRIVSVEFSSPLAREKDHDVYELHVVSSGVTKDSTLRTSVIDVLTKDKDGERVVVGPADVTNLEANYVQAGR